MKTFGEWVEYYNQKTGEAFERKQDFALFFEPKHGFCELRTEPTGVYIWQLCGDLDHWLNMAYGFCRTLELPAITACIVRSPKAFIRRLGFKITETEYKDEQYRYHAVNEKGETLTATQYGDRYIFVWEVST